MTPNEREPAAVGVLVAGGATAAETVGVSQKEVRG